MYTYVHMIHVYTYMYIYIYIYICTHVSDHLGVQPKPTSTFDGSEEDPRSSRAGDSYVNRGSTKSSTNKRSPTKTAP